MFEDFQGLYASSSQSSCLSSSDLSCSFDSASSYGRVESGSTSSWGTPPPSILRQSDSVKLEDIPSPTVNRVEQLRHSSCVSAMSSPISPTSYDMVSNFLDKNLVFSAGMAQPDPTMVGFNSFSVSSSEGFESYQSHDGLHLNTPGLEMDMCSPISGIEHSPASIGFVIPSQTTFIDNYDLNSPIHAPRLLQYHSPTTSDFSQDFPMESMNIMLEYDDCKSTSTSPSRMSTTCRQPSLLQQSMVKPLRTSAALQHALSESPEARQARRRANRERSSGLVLPNNIRIQHAATKLCTWEGCGKRFKRQEHRKRHERTHTHDKMTDSFVCQFCPRRFNRSDNLKAHIKLHSFPDKSQKRTPYHPSALAVWESMTGRTTLKMQAQTDDAAVKMADRRAKDRSRVMTYRGAQAHQRGSTAARLERSRH